MFCTSCRFVRGHCHGASYRFVCLVRFVVFGFGFGFWFLDWFVVCGWFVVVVVVVAVVGLWFAFAVCGLFGFCLFRFSVLVLLGFLVSC